MVLNFTKQNEWYVAEATVNNDYALHIERRTEGFFHMEQSSVDGGKLASCKNRTLLL